MVILSQAQNLVSFFIGLELLSIPLYVMCASAIRREASLESGLKYLVIGSVGSATLLYGFALLYGASGSTDFDAIADALGSGGQADDSLVLIGTAMVAVGPRLQALARSLPPVDARRLPGSADPGHRLHGGRHQGRGLRRARAAVRGRARARRGRLAGGAGGAGGDLDRRRQRRRARPGLAEAAARLLGHRPGRLHAGRDRGRHRDRPRGARLLPRRLQPHEPRRVRRDRRSASARRSTATTSARWTESASRSPGSPGR